MDGWILLLPVTRKGSLLPGDHLSIKMLFHRYIYIYSHYKYKTVPGTPGLNNEIYHTCKDKFYIEIGPGLPPA